MAKNEILSVRTPDGLKALLQVKADKSQGAKKDKGNLSVYVIGELEKLVNNKNK